MDKAFLMQIAAGAGVAAICVANLYKEAATKEPEPEKPSKIFGGKGPRFMDLNRYNFQISGGGRIETEFDRKAMDSELRVGATNKPDVWVTIHATGTEAHPVSVYGTVYATSSVQAKHIVQDDVMPMYVNIITALSDGRD